MEETALGRGPPPGRTERDEPPGNAQGERDVFPRDLKASCGRLSVQRRGAAAAPRDCSAEEPGCLC